MTVPTREVPFHRPAIGEAEKAAVIEVLDSGWLTTGERTLRFEAAFKERLGVRHAVAVNSATAALHLALEGLGIGPDDEVTAARLRGEEYLLERRLLHRLSDGQIPHKRWLHVGFPNGWFYDVGRALDYLRIARTEPDERMAEALGILQSKRDADGRWPLEHAYHDKLLVDLGETEGQPSRWITLRGLRVLRWAGVEQ